ncbi:hypothetical protein M9Y10_041714 [Tritrichomonas musculus]|uniref:YhhN-like protein n=1 Tax=Tritrichomonas musculus TaxID=1915356 RepID=A0ABR2K5C9_9EUKA
MRVSLIIVLLLLTTDISVAMYHYTCLKREVPSPLQPYSPYLKVSFIPLTTCLWYLISPTHSILVFLYALFALGGDAFLLHSDFKVYKYGGVSFFLSHLMMIIFLNISWRRVPLYAYLMMIPCILFTTFVFAPPMLEKSLKSFCFVSYAIILCLGLCNSIARLDHLSFSNPSYLCILIGYFLYFLSDYFLLNLEMFKGYNLRVEVMSTYFTCQILIFVGFAIDPREKQAKEIKKD